MAPASDMFEAGVEVQVLKRGTLFAARGHKLYDAWRRYEAWADVPAAERADIETKILRKPFDEVWAAFEADGMPLVADRDQASIRRDLALGYITQAAAQRLWFGRGRDCPSYGQSASRGDGVNDDQRGTKTLKL